MALVAEYLLLYGGYFRELVCCPDLVLDLLLYEFNGPAFDRKKLHKFFNTDKFGRSFLYPCKGLLKSFHGNIARFGVIALAPHKRVFLNLKNLVDQDLPDELMGVEELLFLIQSGYSLANNFVYGLRNVSKAHFLLMLETLHEA